MILLHVFVLFVGIATAIVTDSTSEVKLYYLNETRPLFYEIHIMTNIHRGDFNFLGAVKIKLRALIDTNRIVVNAVGLSDLKFTLIDLQTGAQFEELAYDIFHSPVTNQNDTLVITLPKDLATLTSESDYYLISSYKGVIHENLRGLYRTSYVNAQNNTVWIASTHMQRYGARSVFPCYDEPSFKAKFRMIITHGRNYSAISNMPILRSKLNYPTDMTTTTFRETPLMSTYLVAIVVSNYVKVTKTLNNLTQRLFYAPNSKTHPLVLQTGFKVLHWMEEYFMVRYPLPKLDHVAISRRVGRAMENWGLIIYHNSIILHHSEVGSLKNMQSAYVIGHEMIHNWFGNLVTPADWKYAWLSEGLSTFYSYKVTNLMNQNWKPLNYALCVDFGETVWWKADPHPLTYDSFSGHLGSSFKANIYYKAAFILRMFESALTEPAFRYGLATYLKKFQYMSVNEDDLFECLQEAAVIFNVPFYNIKNHARTALKSWTSQKGLPLVKVERNYTTETFTIEQKSNKENSSDLWWIPVTFTTWEISDFGNSTTDFTFPALKALRINPADFSKPLSSDGWLILNKEQQGPFRVNYDNRNWELITHALLKDASAIPGLTKAQLLRDAFKFYLEKELELSTFLNLLTYLKSEKDPAPWYEAVIAVSMLLHKIKSEVIREYFELFVRELIKPVFNDVGVHPKHEDYPLTEVIRPKVFTLACAVHLSNCLSTAKLPFLTLDQNKQVFHPNMIFPIYREAVKVGTEEFFMRLYERFLQSTAAERQLIRYALTNTRNSELLRFILLKVVNGVNFTASEKSEFLRNVYSSSNSGLITVIQLIERDDLVEYPDMRRDIRRMVYFVNEQEHLDQIVHLLRTRYRSDMPFSDNVLSKLRLKLKKTLTNYDKTFLEWLQNYLFSM